MPQLYPGVVAHTCSLNTWELGAEGSGAQGQPQSYGEFQASLDM